jgi:heme-degrading monooxygenase HmoA
MSEPALPPEETQFIVLSLFTCAPEQRRELLNLAEDFLYSQLRFQPDLRSIELLADESGEHIVTLARWKDRAAFEAFKRSAAGLEVNSYGLAMRPKVFFLSTEAFLREESRAA